MCKCLCGLLFAPWWVNKVFWLYVTWERLTQPCFQSKSLSYWSSWHTCVYITCYTRRRRTVTQHCLCFRHRPPAGTPWTVRDRPLVCSVSLSSSRAAAAPSAGLSSDPAAASSPGYCWRPLFGKTGKQSGGKENHSVREAEEPQRELCL